VEPIIILAMPRSGSSMTAGLFAKHGVWVGPYEPGNDRNAKGYFESRPFKKALIDNCGKLVVAGKMAPQVEGWREIAEHILRQNGYTGGPWMVKHSAMYYPVWHEFRPKFVCVRRSDSGVKASEKATGMTADIEAHKAALDASGGVDVFTDELVSGDYSSLERAFSHCGVEFDPAIADDFIDPSLWHYR